MDRRLRIHRALHGVDVAPEGNEAAGADQAGGLHALGGSDVVQRAELVIVAPTTAIGTLREERDDLVFGHVGRVGRAGRDVVRKLLFADHVSSSRATA